MKPRRWVLPLLIAVALAATAMAYRHPAVMIQISEQIWACFG